MIYSLLCDPKNLLQSQPPSRQTRSQLYQSASQLPISPPCSFYHLSPNMTHESAHLLSRLLVWDPDKRLTAAQALKHVYVRTGRLRYHTSLCRCCCITANGIRHVANHDFEPIPKRAFCDKYEQDLSSVEDVRVAVCDFINSQPCGRKTPLRINQNSPVFPRFVASTVAHPVSSHHSPAKVM